MQAIGLVAAEGEHVNDNEEGGDWQGGAYAYIIRVKTRLSSRVFKA